MKSRFELQGGFIGLFLILVLLTSSCATESWDFIGTWNYQPDKLTYINPDQRIRLTFPNAKWGAYTKPTKPNEHFKQLWKNPRGEDSSYMVLLAFYPDWPGHDVSMYFYLAPVLGHNPRIEANISLDKYLALISGKMKSKGEIKVDYKVIQRKGRRIGVLTTEGAFYIFFKEKRRFSILFFMCDEDQLEPNKNQFWAIADSYEYLE